MSGLPADFDPLSPSLDHLSMIDEASKGRSQPTVCICVQFITHVLVDLLSIRVFLNRMFRRVRASNDRTGL